MNTLMEDAAERAVRAIRENFGEQLTVDDLAKAAMYSKFYFSRAFKQVTGVSPGRFLSAVRIQEAKRLLLTTKLSVTEIGHRVGYTSISTFSTRFKSSVGLSPSAYRRVGGYAARIPTFSRRTAAPISTSIVGNVRGPAAEPISSIFVGLFPAPVIEGPPVAATVLHGPGTFHFRGVPAGSWCLLALAVSESNDRTVAYPADDDDEVFLAVHGDVLVRTDVTTKAPDLALRPRRPVDPPVLLAVLDLRQAARSSGAVGQYGSDAG
jgi:AraC family transcriptional regulator